MIYMGLYNLTVFIKTFGWIPKLNSTLLETNPDKSD